MTAPASRLGIEKPMTVTMGIRALLRACLRITARSFSPLARAVVTYCSLITSNMLARV